MKVKNLVYKAICSFTTVFVTLLALVAVLMEEAQSNSSVVQAQQECVDTCGHRYVNTLTSLRLPIHTTIREMVENRRSTCVDFCKNLSVSASETDIRSTRGDASGSWSSKREEQSIIISSVLQELIDGGYLLHGTKSAEQKTQGISPQEQILKKSGQENMGFAHMLLNMLLNVTKRSYQMIW